MRLEPETLYHQLRHLVATMPDLNGEDLASPEILLWLGRASALVDATGSMADAVNLATASNHIGSGPFSKSSVQTIVAIVYRALARAEFAAPAVAQGSFIAVGEPFSALAAVSQVLGTAAQTVMIVDPYADIKILTNFAVLAPESTRVLILADQSDHKASLKPAAEHWAQQYASTRPLEVRLAPARSLHDRLIIIDNTEAWTVGQSFNALALRAPTSLVRADPETAKMKVHAYQQIWAGASLLV